MEAMMQRLATFASQQGMTPIEAYHAFMHGFRAYQIERYGLAEIEREDKLRAILNRIEGTEADLTPGEVLSLQPSVSVVDAARGVLKPDSADMQRAWEETYSIDASCLLSPESITAGIACSIL